MSDEAEKRVVILSEARRGLAEAMRQDWVVNAEEGTTPEDVMQSVYWSHVSARMQPFDRIDVRAETGEWLMELLVMQSGRNFALVHKLAFHDLRKTQESAIDSEKFEVSWKGPQRKYAVIRKADSQIVQDGFSDKRSAEVWMDQHEKAAA